jgi:hypothetical protein
MLTIKELSSAQDHIDSTPEGIHELSKIYGSSWKGVEKKTSFGKRFKAAVLTKQLQNIAYTEPPRSDNHHLYKVFFYA